MSAKKLNQILAVEKSTKTRCYALMTEYHKATQKAELLDGFAKVYQPTVEGSPPQPPQSKNVQFNVTDVLKDIQKNVGELFNITATKDWANCAAKSNVTVDGKTLLTGVPATYLLFLDKQLTDMETFVSKFSELDQSTTWTADGSTGLWKTASIETQRTEKLEEPLVLFPATKEHPAQTKVVTKDVVVGKWHTTRYSGAIQKTRKATLLERLQKLHNAVKEALEEANTIQATEQNTADAVFTYLFA